MEFSVEQGKQGSLVWVQRKNGKWWPGKLQLPSSSSKTAVRLLGRESGSVEWFNLEKSTRVKAFRSAEFVDFIRRAESSSHTSRYKKSEKYAYHEDAVLDALLLEKQEQETDHKIQGILTSQVKRRRCSYQPLESSDYVKYSVPYSLQVEESSGQSDLTDSSFEDSDSDEKGGLETSAYYPAYTMLFDAEVTVQANSRREHVPLVSLMSKSNNVAIIGYPAEVEVLESIKGSTNYRLDGVTWKTAKRTKVSYITIPKASASSNLEANANANAAVQAEEEPLVKPGKILSDEASCVPVNRIFSRLINELSG